MLLATIGIAGAQSSQVASFSMSGAFAAADVVRINAGGPQVSVDGNTWAADNCLSSGSSNGKSFRVIHEGTGVRGAFGTGAAVVSSPTSEQSLYQVECYDYSPFSYEVSGLIPGATYGVNLRFAEISIERAGDRQFHVEVNGQRALSSFDPYATAGGPNKGIVVPISYPADGSGKLAIRFVPISGKSSATISAIEMISQSAPVTCSNECSSGQTQCSGNAVQSCQLQNGCYKWATANACATGSQCTAGQCVTPAPVPTDGVRINAGGSQLTIDGNVWSGDDCFSSGTSGSKWYRITHEGSSPYRGPFTTGAAVQSTPASEQRVYQSECYDYAPFTYEIGGVTPGAQYAVKLRFAEISTETQGQRQFQVEVNGQRVLSAFDVYASAGGPNRGVAAPVTAVADNSGKITIRFVPISGKSSATISGIEVLPTGTTVTNPPSNVVGVTLSNTSFTGQQTIRFDTAGNAVDAHDGELRYYNGKYYLYGTSYGCGFEWMNSNSPFCGFKAYSSSDLSHWKDEGFLFDATTPLWQSRCANGCFRPHTLYNPGTGKYVLWINVYDAGALYNYRVFESVSPAGPFTELPTPILATGGNADQDLFLDDDGSGYILYTKGSLGGDLVGSLMIERLNSAFTSGTGQTATIWNHSQNLDGIPSHEAPSMIKHGGRYYVTHGPNCPYCPGTYTEYSTANSPLGVWTFGTNGSNWMLNTSSCEGQPAHVQAIPSAQGTSYLYMSDRWNQRLETYDSRPGGPFFRNQALANYYWGTLSFNSDGSIQPFSCNATVSASVAGAAGAQDPIAGLDQSSGVDGFSRSCDIGSVQRIQTFTPGSTGTLGAVSFTTFQSGAVGSVYPDADLKVDIVEMTSSGQPGTTLVSTTVNPSKVSYSARKLTIPANIPVQAGREYGILLYSPITKGCYGFAYSDANPYPRGRELVKPNAGVSFSTESGRGLKFETIMGNFGSN